jgi:hypothetical protein
MLKIYKILLAFLIIAPLGACTHMHLKPQLFLPPEFDMTPPPGPPIYQQGFKDGCLSGFSGYGNNLPKLAFGWHQDPELSKNETYYQIWKDAYAYCANYANMDSLHGLGNFR